MKKIGEFIAENIGLIIMIAVLVFCVVAPFYLC